MKPSRYLPLTLSALLTCFTGTLLAVDFQKSPQQPRVTPGPSEPDWMAILDALYSLRMIDDLANPVLSSVEKVPSLFRKAGEGPVTYRPVIALGLETPTRGGWYLPSDKPAAPEKLSLWSYQFKNSGRDIETGDNLPPPVLEGSTFSFDPGEKPFGLWVSNDQFDDGGAFSEPARIKAHNSRLAAQPYKAMIYPYRDQATGQLVPHSYLIGWEYSTNDDFQDVVCRIDNVDLIAVPNDERDH